MSNFKVGDVCMFKTQDLSYRGSNLNKIFTLVRYVGKLSGVNHRKMWEIDTMLKYDNGTQRPYCDETLMVKLDNPDNDAVDEMVALVGKASVVKEVTDAV